MPLIDLLKVKKTKETIKHIAEYSVSKYDLLPNTKFRYYNCENAYKTDSHYIVSVGGRESGKSTDWCTHHVHLAVTTGRAFIYVKNKKEQVTAERVVNYLSGHLRVSEKYKELEEYNNWRVDKYKKLVYAQVIDMDTGKLIKEKLICTYRAVEESNKWRSSTLPRKTYGGMLFEEFADDSSIPNAYLKLKTLVSNYARYWEKGNFNVVMISNRTNMNNDYFTSLRVGDLSTQPLDTIRVYKQTEELNGEIITTYTTLENVRNEGKISDFATGKGAGNVAGDEIETFEYPNVIKSMYRADNVYTCYLQHSLRVHKMKFYIDHNANAYWIVEPQKIDLETDDRIFNKRVISSSATIKYNVTAGLIPLSQSEKKMFDTFRAGKVFYKDDRTGTTFNQDLQAIEMTLKGR